MPEEIENRIKIPQFEILGFLDDPITAMSNCQALIVPLFQGAGVKVKVIDSLNSGTPVIGTSVAFEGIMDNDKYKLSYNCSSKEEFAETIENWTDLSVEYKQRGANEFINRYNNNHFPKYVHSK